MKTCKNYRLYQGVKFYMGPYCLETSGGTGWKDKVKRQLPTTPALGESR